MGTGDAPIRSGLTRSGLRISLPGTTGDEVLEDLHDRLTDDPALRPMVRLRPGTPGHGGAGAVAGVLTVALGSGGVLTALASILGTWLTQQGPQGLRIRVERGSHAVEIEGTGMQAAEVKQVLRDLWNLPRR
jgi:hypothetical protein